MAAFKRDRQVVATEQVAVVVGIFVSMATIGLRFDIIAQLFIVNIEGAIAVTDKGAAVVFCQVVVVVVMVKFFCFL